MAAQDRTFSIAPKLAGSSVSMLLRAMVVWLTFMALETIHGTLRMIYMEPAMGTGPAKRLSFFTGSALMFLVIYLLIRWIGAHRRKALLQIGALWVVLTFAFEMTIGRLLGRTWHDALAEYNPFRGGLMFFGMVFLFMAPLIAARLRARRDLYA
jgi:hypothetical protein